MNKEIEQQLNCIKNILNNINNESALEYATWTNILRLISNFKKKCQILRLQAIIFIDVT